MQFYDVIRARRSIRAYRMDPVAPDKLGRIREAVRQAPTACNRQPFRFLEVTSPEKRHAVASCYPREWLADAPLIVIGIGRVAEAWRRPNSGRSIHEVDVAIAMEHLVLAAAAEGLATCWICAFDQVELQKTLGLADEEIPVAMTPLGYAAEEPAAVPRRAVEELFVAC